MTFKDGLTLSLSAIALLISLFTTYFSVVRKEDYLRMVVLGRPDTAFRTSPTGTTVFAVSAADQRATFINLGNQPAEITGLKLDVRGLDPTNKAEGTECGGGDGREIAYEVEPFAVKPGESVTKKLQFAKRLGLDSTEGWATVDVRPKGGASTEFFACMIISVVTPDTVRDDLRQLMLRGVITNNTRSNAFYVADTKPIVLLRHTRFGLW
jgi:hypothetical protein